jgi:hypothetical protein
MNLSCALKRPREWPNRSLANRHIASAIELQQAQRIFCAVTHICVTTNARYCKQIQLWSNDGTGDRQRII